MNIDKNKINYIAKFLEKKELSPGVYELFFEIGSGFEFKSGQYVWLRILKFNFIGSDRRAFSIIRNSENGIISFLFRESESQFKKEILKLSKDDEVEIIGPFGHSFLIPEEEGANLIMICSGVGISPFISICRDFKKNNYNLNLTLIYYDFKNENLFSSEFDNENKIKFKKINTSPEKNDFLDIVNDRTLYYVSGSQRFVNEIYSILSNMDVDSGLIRFENFYPESEIIKKINEILNKELSEMKYSILLSAIKSSSHHVVITDKNGFILFANEAAQKITGYTFDEMRGNTPRLWGGIMSGDFYKKLWSSKLSGEIINEQIVNRRKNGEIYHVISHIDSIKDANGEVIGFIATEEDITDIRNKEMQIQKTKNELERFVSFMADRELKMIEMKNELNKLKEKQQDEK